MGDVVTTMPETAGSDREVSMVLSRLVNSSEPLTHRGRSVHTRAYSSSIRISTLSGRSRKTLRSDVISPISVRVGTELVSS